MEIKYIEPQSCTTKCCVCGKRNKWTSWNASAVWIGEYPTRKTHRTPPRTRCSLSVGIYCYRRTDSGTHRHSKPGTSRTSFRQRYLKAADFNEREVYDFYGIVFIGHPDMRRLYLRNDWVGYPMRKDNEPEKIIRCVWTTKKRWTPPWNWS